MSEPKLRLEINAYSPTHWAVVLVWEAQVQLMLIIFPLLPCHHYKEQKGT